MEDINDLNKKLEEIADSISETTEALVRVNAELDRLTPTITKFPRDNQLIPRPCRSCANHPSNGGSGVCNCILGNQTIY